MRMPVVAPETWYRLFWVLWTVAALVAARMVLVNPIIRAWENLKR